jgi:Carboxypeptidase regulatory-like domain
MQLRGFWIALLCAEAMFAQAGKPADTTKIFGPNAPPKTDKNLMRSVNGTVKDADGNVVGGALVYLKDLKSGKERSIVAGPNGNYQFDDLYKANDYQLRAAKDKLASPTKTLSNFDTRLRPVMNLTLEAKPAPESAASAEKK